MSDVDKQLKHPTNKQIRNIYEKLNERLSILDFIPVEEHEGIKNCASEFDCYEAINEAINSVTTGSGWAISGPAIYFPNGKYKVSNTIHIKRRVRLYGDGSGLPSSDMATIEFAADVSGFVIHRWNTDKNGIEDDPTTAADGSIIEGLSIHGGGNDPSAHGIWLRARALIRSVQIAWFPGNGINIVADSTASGIVHGNANCFEIEVVRIINCKKNGIYVEGGDTNAGIVKGADVTGNYEWGVFDSSFLGNTYIGCHAAANGGGAYKSDGINARNIFLGCYSESGQPSSNIVAPSMVIGGAHGEKVEGNGYFAIDSGFDVLNSKNEGGAKISVGTKAGNTENSVMCLRDPTYTQWPYVLDWTTGRWRLAYAYMGNGEHLSLYSCAATKEAGYERDMARSSGGIGLPNGFFGKGMRYRGEASAPPTDDEWLVGDILYNEKPEAGGFIGWTLVVTKEWKPFGKIQ